MSFFTFAVKNNAFKVNKLYPKKKRICDKVKKLYTLHFLKGSELIIIYLFMFFNIY